MQGALLNLSVCLTNSSAVHNFHKAQIFSDIYHYFRIVIFASLNGMLNKPNIIIRKK